METEQLKLILETLRTLGEASKEGFLWWVLLDKGPIVICSILIPSVIGLAILAVYKANTKYCEYKQFAEEVFSLIGYRRYEVYTKSHRDEVIKYLKDRLNV
jgi:hypothetical protein